MQGCAALPSRNYAALRWADTGGSGNSFGARWLAFRCSSSCTLVSTHGDNRIALQSTHLRLTVILTSLRWLSLPPFCLFTIITVFRLNLCRGQSPPVFASSVPLTSLVTRSSWVS